MRKQTRVSVAVVKRLPKYYRYLRMIGDKGITRVSSQELSEITGFTASQIRQDLNHFGGFGQQGYGYNVEELHGEIEKIMGIDRDYSAIVVGAGNIGQGVAKYDGFKESGFRIQALFDKSEALVGTEVDGHPVLDADGLLDYLKANPTEIAIVAVPADKAQATADILAEGGVKGIWNFAPVDLKLPEGMVLENVHLDESLYTLTYFMNNLKDYTGAK